MHNILKIYWVWIVIHFGSLLTLVLTVGGKINYSYMALVFGYLIITFAITILGGLFITISMLVHAIKFAHHKLLWITPLAFLNSALVFVMVNSIKPGAFMIVLIFVNIIWATLYWYTAKHSGPKKSRGKK